jgi:hypothetical protein
VGVSLPHTHHEIYTGLDVARGEQVAHIPLGNYTCLILNLAVILTWYFFLKSVFFLKNVSGLFSFLALRWHFIVLLKTRPNIET